MAVPAVEAPGAATLTFKVKLLHEQSDMTVDVSSSDSCLAIVQQIRVHNNWDASKHIRLICSGKELHADDPVSSASANVLHCIATDGVPAGYAALRKAALAASVEQPPLDMLDVVDPGTVLMWIFGSILALLWLLFIFSASMFDKTSLVMLCIMTVAFLIPCMLSYLPWLPAMAGPATATSRPPLGSSYGNSSYGNSSYGNSSYGNGSYGNGSYGNGSYGNGSYGNGSSYGTSSSYGASSGSVQQQQQQWPGALGQRQWGGQGYYNAGAIPPRPAAQRRPVPAAI